MQRSGTADLPLHNGHVPQWLAERMSRLGGAIAEAIILEYGKSAFLSRLSNPFWFQALGAVMGMDWHSSGITTSVMGALKKAINPKAKELGVYICGGRGKHSRQTPTELLKIAEYTGIDGHLLVQHSKLTAKVDNNALQDGFQLYLHNFIVTHKGEWAVIQQGMNDDTGTARRYHWHSPNIKSFVEEPHTAVEGKNVGKILNLTAQQASSTRNSILSLMQEPAKHLPEIHQLLMPAHHDVRMKDVNMKRLGAVLAIASEKEILDFETLLLLEGVGPRTIQSLTLVSEIIYGTPSRFNDPARFSFAHGGKDGRPFPVTTTVYDEMMEVFEKTIQQAKLENTDKQAAFKKLHTLAQQVEQDFIPKDNLDKLIEKEWEESYLYGGRTIFGKSMNPLKPPTSQLSLF